MLVLTRRIGEIIRIGDDVSFQVLEIKGNQVRFGLNAPKDVKIHREEIYQRIQKERAGFSYTRHDHPFEDTAVFHYSRANSRTH